MRRYFVVGHRACTTGDFSLNDMPGSAGRMDVLCRCVNSCFFLSHDLRHDVECYLVMLGDPESPKTVFIRGSEVRHLSPDERSAGSLIKKALSLPCGTEFRESTKGVYVRKGGLDRLLSEHSVALLDEGGEDIREMDTLPESLLLSDHMNFSEEEMDYIKTLPRVSVGPCVLHADHTIIIMQNEMDRREK